MRYLITGGGTGGHIYPALAIANEIRKRHKNAKILYVGTEKGLESELVPREGYEFRTIRVKGMPRRINKEAFIALKELFLGLKDANRIIKEFNPDIVIGTGGYVCGPVVYKASKKKIPTIIHEQNAFPGITNKILSRYVDKVLVTFEESIKYFKYPEKVIVTGNPIRKSILEVDLNKAYRDLNVNPNVPFILSFGGSGGQKKLNDAMLYVIKNNISKDHFQIFHVTGKRFYEDFMNRLKEERVKLNNNIRVFPYFYDMPKAINIADLVITSAGAITLAEISAVGIPSILIPKGYTAENHQEYNARVFEQNGASLVILEKDLTGDKLEKAIYTLIKDKKILENMRKNSKKIGRINAVDKIVDIIDSLIM
ncbi:UDP-N-acetylglucosamine-N-acetylmuramylpentapeptide N-acetylglucosamine transferase [Keratinibaculum paraultunense]|uniref:UDP-N-acetylglucosamine--N-acetylmuramyl-(pentapeptide) pyrophosphoryl-undecaprenol N-acetylglucosamine transferase n=1 Tax=Keratinibaculum paraultunense TaxID=1278232 RepID=A0A4R3L234_9FIRM|nr:undecaprenyldiphospho-muramoylpentapeptide beta-N-acetylglucosaminyltransferase [Keratinibaculum paraultunense]QQY80538.1 undecaprenyldiphospho-muramoylpentapeptide beta-N-acetylglucosaminyltransferase [Keratinibaculum paraultunense]TCS91261.1 UDP-N-acetylglucosamine-N-acetylmuramylpentapeptide N-acetylglucosamine transferase [Keratinibaculum paraultunense]